MDSYTKRPRPASPPPYTVRRLADGQPNGWVVVHPRGYIVASCRTRRDAQGVARRSTHYARQGRKGLA